MQSHLQSYLHGSTHNMELNDLGDRICIMGPSNSGKSTLAVAIARAKNLEVIHLDQIHHIPHTDWVVRPESEFTTLHDAAILGERWVIDGNYSRLLPQRIARATGLIMLDAPTTTSLVRYLLRSLFKQDRRGALQGAKDQVQWRMIRHIAITTRANRRRYKAMVESIHLPKIQIRSTKDLDHFYKSNDLIR